MTTTRRTKIVDDTGISQERMPLHLRLDVGNEDSKGKKTVAVRDGSGKGQAGYKVLATKQLETEDKRRNDQTIYSFETHEMELK